MSGYNCSNFTGLIHYFQVLPTITNLDANNSREFSSADFDKFVRAWFWGAAIVMVTVALVIASWFYYCCVCCCYCCGGRNDDEKPRAMRVGCCFLTTLLIVPTLGLGGVIIWMELMFNDGIVENYFEVGSILNATVLNQSNASTAFIDFVFFERYRHYITISWIGIVAAILLMSLLFFVCSIKCKSQACVNVCILVFTVTSLLSAAHAGVLFFYLISLSDQCQDIQSQLDVLCTTNFTTNDSFIEDVALQFDSLCNVTSQCGFILLALACGLVLFFILIQIVTAQFAGSLTRSKFKYVEYSSEIVISAPISASGPGVWGAYGTQSLMGTTSQSQNVSQPYSPRNPLISPNVQQYMLHQNSDDGVTYNNYQRQQSQRSEATHSFDFSSAL